MIKIQCLQCGKNATIKEHHDGAEIRICEDGHRTADYIQYLRDKIARGQAVAKEIEELNQRYKKMEVKYGTTN